MNNELAHRGPDAEGSWVGEGIALGHRRLAIIDLSESGGQPMQDPAGRFTLVYNGEIYNYKALREELRAEVSAAGWSFRSQCDTEVLLYGLALHGIDFLQRCNGMFAFGFWDAVERRLLLARDRMGIKPLYYTRSGSLLAFSSELRALLKAGLSTRLINPVALADYLRYQTVHGERSIVEDVHMLPQGSALTLDENEALIRTWWHPVRNAITLRSNATYEDTKQLVKQHLERAVQSRLVADVPFGAFLSGGIDSSAIVALAANAGTAPLRTFTVAFEEDSHNEAPHARRVAERYGTAHTEIALSVDGLLQKLPDALQAMDHPTGDGINTFVVSQAAKMAGIDMVLSGLGGDELFAGYPIFTQINELQSKKWLLSYPKFARAVAGAAYHKVKPGVASAKIAKVIREDYFDTEYAYQYSRELYSVNEVMSMLEHYKGGANEVFRTVQEVVGYGNEGYALPLLSRVSYAEFSTYLHSVLLRDTDQMSMANALEVRVPFLDHKLVELVLGIPDKYKYPHTPKKLLVDAMGDMLPSEVVNRPKMGFTLPWEQWMRGALRDFCHSQMEALSKRPQFNQKRIAQRWQQFLNGHPEVGWSRIWYLCALESWLQRNEVS
jgi:asparagine synthase (glutamine-hydrolysing)